MTDAHGPNVPDAHQAPTKICTRAIATFAYDVDEHEPHFFALGCRNWSCPECGPRRRHQLIGRITRAAPTKFITLSCRHELGPQPQLETITQAFPKLIATIRKHNGPIEYLRALEYCADGYPHFHMLARTKFIEQRFLSEHWQRLSGAPVVDIRKAHGRSTRYIAKYLSKSTGGREWNRQTFAVSRHFWTDNPQDQPTQWLNWSTKRIPALEEACNICEQHSLERIALGCYHITEREPGDEIPYELNPKHWIETT